MRRGAIRSGLRGGASAARTMADGHDDLRKTTAATGPWSQRYSEGDLKSGSSRNDPNWRTLICRNKFDDRLGLRGQTIVVGGIGATDGTQSSHEPDCEDEGVK